VIDFITRPNRSQNHTVTESSFAVPCKPLAANLTSPTHPGQRSGFVPVTADQEFTPVYNLLVNDTKPIWIYCGQVNHCEKGMAMVINQNNSSPNTIEAYIANAAKIPLVNVTTPPAASAPPPPPAGSPAAQTGSFSFGGGGGGGFGSTAAAPPPAETAAPASTSTTAVQPSTFTGAAVPGFTAPDTSMVGLLVGALLAMW